MKTYLMVALLAGLAGMLGCEKAAIRSEPTNNKEVQVELLFEHDGCRVYRFTDAARPIYYVNCGASVQTGWNYRCGKNCTQYQSVQTN